jgi:hypothetical protein
LVISDGDISDQEAARKDIGTFLKTSKYSTVDFALIRSNLQTTGAASHFQKNAKAKPHQTALNRLADILQSDMPNSNIQVAQGLDPNKIPMDIVGMMLEKIRATNSFTAIPHKRKRQLMRRTHNQLK